MSKKTINILAYSIAGFVILVVLAYKFLPAKVIVGLAGNDNKVSQVLCSVPVQVSGQSMEPILKQGSRVNFNKCFEAKDIQEGTAVMFKDGAVDRIAMVDEIKDDGILGLSQPGKLDSSIDDINIKDVLAIYILDDSEKQIVKDEPLIGGDKDEGGCLVGAGYSWCEIKQKCLRVWEEPCEEGTQTSLVKLTSPTDGQEIQSPLTVEGEASGSWFFEGDFPVILTDWDGRIIAQGIATAEGDWMTENYVPFKATLEFTPDTTVSNRGSLILKKDNPSGLPQYDDAFEITVFFK